MLCGCNFNSTPKIVAIKSWVFDKQMSVTLFPLLHKRLKGLSFAISLRHVEEKLWIKSPPKCPQLFQHFRNCWDASLHGYFQITPQVRPSNLLRHQLELENFILPWLVKKIRKRQKGTLPLDILRCTCHLCLIENLFCLLQLLHNHLRRCQHSWEGNSAVFMVEQYLKAQNPC